MSVIGMPRKHTVTAADMGLVPFVTVNIMIIFNRVFVLSVGWVNQSV